MTARASHDPLDRCGNGAGRRVGARRCGVVFAWLAVASLAACAHGEGGAGEPKAAARPEPASSPPLHAHAHAHAHAQGEQGEAPPPERSIEDFMADHFLIATFSRDAVINGDLESLREPLTALAQHDYAGVAPGGWMPWIAELQQAASLTAQAQRLDAAASGVAALARVCGGCHEAQGRGPHYVQAHEDDAPRGSRTLADRMYRHMWALDRLWEGLTAPSDQAWVAGAKALARVAAEPSAQSAALSPSLLAALAELRALSIDVTEATTLDKRANVYGLLLATCADCHTHAALVRQ